MIKDQPEISVLMPVYNGDKYLGEAIESILNQTFSNFEFIIINDGSTDKTEDIIQSYTDSRIVYIKNENNLQLIKSLNKGLAVAKGKYLARMDADDISLPERLKIQHSIFYNYIGIDIVNIKFKYLLSNGKTRNSHCLSLGFESISFVHIYESMICHPGVMVKTNLIKQYGYTDHPKCYHIEDWELWVRMLKDGRICYTIETPLILYRLTPDSINSIQSGVQITKKLPIAQFYISKCLGFNFNNYISDNAFLYLLGDKQKCNNISNSDINNFIKNYLFFISNKFYLSYQCKKDLEKWRINFLFRDLKNRLKCENFFIFIKSSFYFLFNVKLSDLIKMYNR